MCEFSQRLVAWLDGELPEGEAVEMERHLGECVRCRELLDTYRQVSDVFGAYCNAHGAAALSAKPGRISLRSARTVSGAAAIAAIVAAFFLLTARLRQSPVRTPAGIGSAAGARQPVQTAQEKPAGPLAAPVVAPVSGRQRLERSTLAEHIIHAAPDRRLEGPRPEEDADSLAGAPAVEIAIPADAIFPPGAVPAGVSFTADVTIATDGSAEQIRLRPQLTEFERKGAQR